MFTHYYNTENTVQQVIWLAKTAMNTLTTLTCRVIQFWFYFDSAAAVGPRNASSLTPLDLPLFATTACPLLGQWSFQLMNIQRFLHQDVNHAAASPGTWLALSVFISQCPTHTSSNGMLPHLPNHRSHAPTPKMTPSPKITESHSAAFTTLAFTNSSSCSLSIYTQVLSRSVFPIQYAPSSPNPWWTTWIKPSIALLKSCLPQGPTAAKLDIPRIQVAGAVSWHHCLPHINGVLNSTEKFEYILSSSSRTTTRFRLDTQFFLSMNP